MAGPARKSSAKPAFPSTAKALPATPASVRLARGDELGELLERCQQANLRNGRIIRANQASTGSLLNILRGQDAPSLYDSRGGTASSSRQRPLSQA